MNSHLKLHSVKLISIIFTWSAIACCAPVFAQESGVWSADEKYTLVHQFYGTFPTGLPAQAEKDQFKQLVEKQCGGSSRISSAVVGGGVLLDWIAGRAISAANKKLDRYIKEHTATYISSSAYSNIGDDSHWEPDLSTQKVVNEPESCVLVTRIHCPSGSAPRSNWTGCITHLRFAAIIRHQEVALRILPIALSVKGLEARHSKGKATIGLSFEIQAISPAIEGGRRWSSGEIPLVAEAFSAKKANPKKGEFGLTEQLIEFSFDGSSWSTAPVLPVPPNMQRPTTLQNPSLATFKVTIAEVGRPSAFGKRLADLLSTKEDDLAGALGAALKKAADIEDN